MSNRNCHPSESIPLRGATSEEGDCGWQLEGLEIHDYHILM
jgi:hypothetical protein